MKKAGYGGSYKTKAMNHMGVNKHLHNFNAMRSKAANKSKTEKTQQQQQKKPR